MFYLDFVNCTLSTTLDIAMASNVSWTGKKDNDWVRLPDIIIMIFSFCMMPFQLLCLIISVLTSSEV